MILLHLLPDKKKNSHPCSALHGEEFPFYCSFLMPNNLRKRPRRHFGLRMTMICISTPAFLLYFTQNRPEMFRLRCCL